MSSVTSQVSILGGIDRPFVGHVLDELEQTLPVLGAHQHDGEALDLACLDQGQRLEQLVHRAEAARQRDEAVGVLEEEYLADEEVMNRDRLVEEVVRRLLGRQIHAAGDRAPARLPGTAVRGFHQTGAPAGHDREAEMAERTAHAAPERVVLVPLVEPGRTEDGDARTDEGERPEARDEVLQRAED